LKEIKQIIYEIIYSKRKTSRKTSSVSKSSLKNDLASGLKYSKNKTRKSKYSIFNRKPKQKRFKNPFFLSLK
jgi:hypothetical protein